MDNFLLDFEILKKVSPPGILLLFDLIIKVKFMVQSTLHYSRKLSGGETPNYQ